MRNIKIVPTFSRMAFIVLLGAAQPLLANDRLNMRQFPEDFDLRIEKIYTDKNRLLPQPSTVDIERYFHNKAIEAELTPAQATEQVPKSNVETMQMGGVSDGGGNAVGTTLFDFYENEGSLEISIEELLWLEPRMKDLLAYLNTNVPAISRKNSGGFGEILKQSLSGKRIYLESKGISSTACLNQSMVSAPNQSVVACQSDKELRLNIEWLRSTNAHNRMGLLLHELILAWARGLENGDNKAQLEQKVRELNRQIFASFETRRDVSHSIMEVFGVKAFNPSRYQFIQHLPNLVYQTTRSFCAHQKIDVASAFRYYLADKVLANEIPDSVRSMESIANRVRSGEKVGLYSNEMLSICEGYLIDNAPLRAPQTKSLSQKCQSDLSEQVTNLITSYDRKGSSAINVVNSRSPQKAHFILINMLATSCSGLKGRQHGDMGESYIYVRWQLKERGFEASFLEGKIMPLRK